MNDTSPQSCGEHRIALGAYVLGSLDPAERAEVDRHLAACPNCREALADLAAVPGLLARTTVEDLRAADVSALPAQAERAVQELIRRRRTAGHRRILAAAASLVLIAGGVGVGLAVTNGSGTGGTTVSATNAATQVSARVDIASHSTGTAFTVHLSGVAPGERCTLVAVSRSGGQETAANWIATYQGKADVHGESAIARQDLTSLSIVTAAGRQLVAIPVR